MFSGRGGGALEAGLGSWLTCSKKKRDVIGDDLALAIFVGSHCSDRAVTNKRSYPTVGKNGLVFWLGPADQPGMFLHPASPGE